MDRNLVLSAIAAAAIHGGVFFGWPKGEAPVKTKPSVSTVEIITLPPSVKDDDPVPPPEDPQAQAPKGAPRPVGDEAPVIGKLADFTMPVIPRPPVDAPRVPISLNEPPGQPGGLGLGKPDILPRSLLDNSPQTRAQSSPVYPYAAKRDGLTGTVHVEFTVDESGRVLDPRVTETTNPIFNDATVQAVLKWRFEPGRHNGKVVRFRMVAPVVFSLE